jgi:hypothetical protein
LLSIRTHCAMVYNDTSILDFVGHIGHLHSDRKNNCSEICRYGPSNHEASGSVSEKDKK